MKQKTSVGGARSSRPPRSASRRTLLSRGNPGFTFVEVLVVIAALLVLASLVLPFFARARAKSPRIECVNNLKEIGTAYRLWIGDGGDKPQTQKAVEYGGWADFLTNANQGALCWTNYAIMAGELGQSPNVVVCPADKRRPALNLTNDFKDNTHVSYFVGVCASDIYPQSFLGGDRNLGPGTKPDPDYGFSPKSGKGNDVILPLSGAVCWSLKMHSAGYATGAGNILLGDGSCQLVSTLSLNQNWLTNAQGSDNWPAGHVPATPSIRLVFP
jgi:prepilin-type N-terminal cleavage/methylation domain-containing protein